MSKSKGASRPVLLYGVHPVVETLRAERRRIREIIVARSRDSSSDLQRMAAHAGIPISNASPDDLTSLAGSPHHQGIVARVEPFVYADVTEILARARDLSLLVLLLDGIQDPGNLGSILRSAECLGAAGIVLPKDRVVSITPAVEKASAGASAHLPVARVVNLVRTIESLKAEGFWIYCADAGSSRGWTSVDLTGTTALVLGSEGKGVRRLVRERCDGSISIPMIGRIESLSVSQSAAILLAEAARQRGARQRPPDRARNL